MRHIFWPSQTLAKDLKVTVEQRVKNRMGIFSAVGPLSTFDQPSQYDILELVEKIPKSALKLLNELKQYRDSDNFAVLTNPYNYLEDPSGYKSRSKAFSILRKHDFSIQLKTAEIAYFELNVQPNQQAFMINPEFIRCPNYHQNLRVWKKLTST